MKKYSFCFIISIIILIFSVVTPEVMYSSLPSVEYTKVTLQSVDVNVSVKGKICADENNKLFALLYVGEDIYPKIKKGQNLIISGSALGEKVYKGKIDKIGDVTNTDNSVAFVAVKASINNIDKKLKSGFNIKAKVIIKKFKNKIIVPSNCISQDENGEFVYKLNQTKVKKTYIKTGEITSNGTIVLKGLTNNEYIVTNPENLSKAEEDVAIKNV